MIEVGSQHQLGVQHCETGGRGLSRDVEEREGAATLASSCVRYIGARSRAII